ncbi:hypothetical protein, partial [Enterococcus pallens]
LLESVGNSGAGGSPFRRPFRPRPVKEAFSRRANHPLPRVVLINIIAYFSLRNKKTKFNNITSNSSSDLIK